jgi:hypothetical protein
MILANSISCNPALAGGDRMHCRQTFVTAILCELLLIGARFFFTGHLGPGTLPGPFSVKRAVRLA